MVNLDCILHNYHQLFLSYNWHNNTYTYAYKYYTDQCQYSLYNHKYHADFYLCLLKSYSRKVVLSICHQYTYRDLSHMKKDQCSLRKY